MWKAFFFFSVKGERDSWFFKIFLGISRVFFLGIKMYVDGFSQTTARRGSGVAWEIF